MDNANLSPKHYASTRNPTDLESLLDRQIREAPEPLRSFVRELQGPIDLAATIRELVFAREYKNALGAAVSELKSAIRKHRDMQDSKLHRNDDIELYGLLD
jgi:hypothetical protein